MPIMTAQEANRATKERVATIAAEFITNNVSVAISEAIDNAEYSTLVSLSGVPNSDVIAEEIVNKLIDKGFEAEYGVIEDDGGSTNTAGEYISIGWDLVSEDEE